MGPIKSIADLWSLFRRRIALIMTILLVGLLVSLYLAVTAPSAYEARSVIQIDAPVLSDPVTRSAPPASLRVQQIEQRLMSRGNMLRLIDRYDLFDDIPDLPESLQIEILRGDTRIESVAASTSPMNQTSSLSSIVIYARAGLAQTAANIANDLANDVVTSDRRNREARITEADTFLTNELRRIEERLVRQDRDLSQYTAANEDSLPEARAYLQTELVSLTARESATEQALMELQRDRLDLERTSATDDSASIVQQLRATEVALAQARRTLPAGHPEIQRLERQIRDITEGGADTAGAGLGRQLRLIDSQIDNLEADLSEIADRRLEIEGARNRAPEVMQAYEQMQRARQNQQDQYAELSRRLAEIEALRMLSDNDQTENMVILEPAVPPEFPVASNRKRSAILGTFASFAIAGGLAFLLDLMNPVLRNARQFESVTGIRPVISLPYRPTRAYKFRRFLVWTYVFIISLISLAVALWMINLMPPAVADLLPHSPRVIEQEVVG